jgi:muconolactone delta-isomerase
MDFMVRMRALDPIPLPAPDLADLALRQLEYWERLESEGKLVYTAPFVGRRARVAIYRVDSNDELFTLINQDPLFRYLEREVVPLATNEQLRGLYESIRDDGDRA